MSQAKLATPKEVVETEKSGKGHTSLDGWKVIRKGSKSAPHPPHFPAGHSGGKAATKAATKAGVIATEAEAAARTTMSTATAASTRLEQDGRGNAST